MPIEQIGYDRNK
jgi:phosphoenolpyruvate carboxykinase (ATP)